MVTTLAVSDSKAGLTADRQYPGDLTTLYQYYERRSLEGEDLTLVEMQFAQALARYRFDPPAGKMISERLHVMVFGGAARARARSPTFSSDRALPKSIPKRDIRAIRPPSFGAIRPTIFGPSGWASWYEPTTPLRARSMRIVSIGAYWRDRFAIRASFAGMSCGTAPT